MNKQRSNGPAQTRRLRKIVALMRERDRLTREDLAHANECSPRTIQRDIDVLKANGWPIESDNNGHFFGEAYYKDLKMSQNRQVASLVLAGCAIDRHLVECFPDIALELSGSLFNIPDLDSMAFNIEDSSIYEERCTMTEEQLEIFGATARNILDGLAIEFLYRSVSSVSPRKRCVYPISLRQKENIWYLIGYDLEVSILKVYTLSKVKDVLTYAAPYEEPGDNIIKHALSFGEFSMWDTGGRQGRTYSVKVRLTGHAADFVRIHNIHRSQEVEIVNESTVILRLETSDLTGMNLWLRKFMHLVQIIEPKELKEHFVRDLKESLSLNS